MPSMPDWATWVPSRPYTIGIEEEFMLLEPDTLALAQRGADAMDELPAAIRDHLSRETHGCALELSTAPEESVPRLGEVLEEHRNDVERELGRLGLAVASAGTHPFAMWTDIEVSSTARYRRDHDSMRELARREPTFALHVHVGVADAERATRLHDRLRAHLPLLLALSANSPFWQARDSGLASARTSIFQAFPRVGIPRGFGSYAQWVEAVDVMLRCGAFPEPTYLWWDVRLQPRFGTVEVRIMDAQSCAADTVALCALVQSLARLELEEGYASPSLLRAPEVLAENRFLAARDGMDAAFLDPDGERTVPAQDELARVLAAAAPHAAALGCAEELATVEALGRSAGAERQRRRAAEADGLEAVVADLALCYGESAASLSWATSAPAS
jgi:carboxylate-amine ligase